RRLAAFPALLIPRLVQFAQFPPALALTTVVMAPGPDRPVRPPHDERRAVGVVLVPGTRLQNPAVPGAPPRTVKRDVEVVACDPPGEVEAGGNVERVAVPTRDAFGLLGHHRRQRLKAVPRHPHPGGGDAKDTRGAVRTVLRPVALSVRGAA